MADSIEREWQFDVADLERVGEWLRSQPPHAPLTFAQVRDREQVDSYFDTADWRLYHVGFSLRRRRSGEAYELTLKAIDGTADGPIARREISEVSPEGAFPGAEGPVSERVRLVAGRRVLRPLFDVRTRRRTFAVSRREERVAVVELDETAIAAGDTLPAQPVTTFRRVEVEMADGTAAPAALADIESFVAAMAEACGLIPASLSKYEMGLHALDLDPSSALAFGDERRDPERGVLAYAYGWLRAQWTAFLRHEPGTRLGEDIEELHQMRVATRRLQAAIRVFEPILPEAFTRLRGELQWVGHELGAVRDLDVQIEGLEARREAASWIDSAALVPLIAVVERERDTERVRLIELLNSTRYDALVDEMSRLLRMGSSAGETDASPVPVVSFAAPVLRQRYRRLRRDIRNISTESPAEELHALRIRAKRLRYSLEIFGNLYGVSSARFTASVKAAQDHLGEHQDADVGIERLRAIVGGEGRALPAETLVAVGRLMEQYTYRMKELREGASPVLARVRRRWRPLSQEIARAVATAELPGGRDGSVADPGSDAMARASDAEGEVDSHSLPPAYPLSPPGSGATLPRVDDGTSGTLGRMRQLFQRDGL